MSNHISNDLIVDIFSRLPTKSLLRFRSVSKSLHACIGNPSFTRLHTLRSPKKFVIIHEEKEISKHIYTMHSESQLTFDRHPYNDVTPVECPIEGTISFGGSCNGIVCVYEHVNHRIHLWNPSIRRKVTLPCFPSCDTRTLLVGFGFDPIIDDYKILRMSDWSSFVYTVKTQTWREIEPPTTMYPYAKTCQCFFNGALHWIVTCDDSVNYIMSFDLNNEVFSTIELPNARCKMLVVTIVNGCLALISSKRNYSKIWLRRENNNTGASWSLAFEMQAAPFAGANVVFQCADNLFLVNKYKKIMRYNYDERMLTYYTGLQSLSGSSYIATMSMCYESLEFVDTGYFM